MLLFARAPHTESMREFRHTCVTLDLTRLPDSGTGQTAGGPGQTGRRGQGQESLCRVAAWTGKESGKRAASRVPWRSRTSDSVPSLRRSEGPGHQLPPGVTHAVPPARRPGSADPSEAQKSECTRSLCGHVMETRSRRSLSEFWKHPLSFLLKE